MARRTDRAQDGNLERRLIDHVLGCEAIRVFAPFGLDDLFNLTVRANRTRITPETYAAKAERVRMRWPEVTILPWEAGYGGPPSALRHRTSSP